MDPVKYYPKPVVICSLGQITGSSSRIGLTVSALARATKQYSITIWLRLFLDELPINKFPRLKQWLSYWGWGKEWGKQLLSEFKLGRITEEDFFQRCKALLGAPNLTKAAFTLAWNAMAEMNDNAWNELCKIVQLQAERPFDLVIVADTNDAHVKSFEAQRVIRNTEKPIEFPNPNISTVYSCVVGTQDYTEMARIGLNRICPNQRANVLSLHSKIGAREDDQLTTVPVFKPQQVSISELLREVLPPQQSSLAPLARVMPLRPLIYRIDPNAPVMKQALAQMPSKGCCRRKRPKIQ